MSIAVVSPPDVAVVDLEDAKAQLRIGDSEQDGLLQNLIATATQALDGPRGWLGRALITQTLEMRCANFSARLVCPPVTAITALTYLDCTGTEQTIDIGTVRLIGKEDAPQLIPTIYGSRWPSLRAQPEAVTIRYTAGYGDASGDVPAPIRQAILLTVAHLFENRQAVYVDSSRVMDIELPQGVEYLLSPFRTI